MRTLETAGGLETVTCALCDSRWTRICYRKFGLPIVACLRCGLVFANPRPPRKRVWQRYSARYFEREYLPARGVVNGHIDLPYFDVKYASLLARLEATVGKGRLFEIGAGDGLFLAAARRAGWTVSGIELSPAAVAFCRDRLHLDVTECLAEDIPLDLPPFDAVAMFDVIEHLFDPMQTLATVRRLLRPGGVLVLTTPNYRALSRRALGAQWSVLNPFEHLFYFTEKTLARALGRYGFGDIAFDRHYSGTVQDTMNPKSTHAPGSRRARWYDAWVSACGPRRHWFIQSAGLGDLLCATARANENPGESRAKRG
jgi:SAM-dependent methyltransferase